MVENNRSLVLRASYAAAFFALGALIFYFFRNVSYLYAFLVWFGLHQFVIVPSINRSYCKITGNPINKTRSYIPLINETDIFTPLLSMLTMILGICIYFIGFILLLPMIGLNTTEFYYMVFGAKLAMNIPFYLEVILVSLYVIINVVRGLGFATIAGVVDSEMQEYYRIRPNNTLLLGRLVVLFFPFVRTISLAQINNRLNNLVKIHRVDAMEEKEFLEE